ncbi:MAG: Bacterial alpha-L-rhamnosidase [Propionibacteriales bacterium]|nr:Bacterial alpha-L-rhamnosidase [Propionibacteriales bacterium]
MKSFRATAAALAAGLVVTAISVPPLAQAAPSGGGGGDIDVATLTADGERNPLGIGGDAPSLAWKLRSDTRAQKQSAYQVLVASSAQDLDRGNGDVWDSGRVESAGSIGVGYEGPDLESRTRYHWMVRVWDADGTPSRWSEPAWFETGLLSGDDWQADWIQHDTVLPLPTSNSQQNTPAELLAGKTLGQTFTTDRPFDSAGGSFPTWNTADSDFTLTLRADVPSGAVVATRRFVDHPDNSWAEIGLDTDAAPGTYFLEMSEVEGKAGWWSHTGNVYEEGEAYADGQPVAGDRTVRWHPTIESDDEQVSQLRKDFRVAKSVRSARLYSTALGVYDVSINGRAVSRDRFTPGWTDYDKRVQYQTYDVTSLVRRGDNAIGARVAPGWYSGRIAIFGPQLYGKLPGLLGQLEITYTDGSREVVGTDDSWRSTQGPIQSSDMLDGEVYDAQEETPGWDRPGYDDAAWKPVVPKSDVTADLVAQADPPVRVTEERPAEKRTEPESGTFIYDLGQNMVGTAELEIEDAAAGQEITVRYGEALNPDGTLYTANLRSAKATDHYVAKGDRQETFDPAFTFHGFRYVEVTGYPGTPAKDAVTGKVIHTDTPVTGSLETSSEMLNQLQSNITWSQRGNFLSVPTDCPQRDERMGWTGDINVFAPTAAYNMDVSRFLGDKWMQDLRDAQRSDGAVTDVVPFVPVVGAGNAGWGDAAVTVPYTVWQSYGDTSVIEDNYEAMAAWVGYLEANSDGYLRPDAGYGDWLNLDDPTPRDLIGTAYFAHVSGLLSEMAEAIGRSEDAERYADLAADVTEAFNAEYVGADGTLTGDAQAGYVLALSFDLLPDDLVDDAAGHLVANLERHDWHLATGFLGTPDLLAVLSKTGHEDVAYRLLNNRTYPSWGYEIEKGATTIWERWNSIMPDGSFGDVNMNSFNHYAYGAVGNWMYQNIAGIIPGSPGYETSIIKPKIGGGLTHAEGTHESPYGEIATSWRVLGNGDLVLTVTVPVNTSATVHVPADAIEDVREGDQPATEAEGVEVVGMEGEAAVFDVGSGSYRFTVRGDR